MTNGETTSDRIDVVRRQTSRKRNSRRNTRKVTEKRKASELEFLRCKVQRNCAKGLQSSWIRDVLWQWLRGNWIQSETPPSPSRNAKKLGKIAPRHDSLSMQRSARNCEEKYANRQTAFVKIHETRLFDKFANLSWILRRAIYFEKILVKVRDTIR